MNTFSTWPPVTALQDTDEVLTRRPGDLLPEKRAALSAFDARFLRAPATIGNNVLHGTDTDGNPETKSAGPGIAVSDGQVAADGSDHLEFALMAIGDFNAEVIVNSGGQVKRLPLALLLALLRATLGLPVTLDVLIAVDLSQLQTSPTSPIALPPGRLWLNGGFLAVT